MKKYDCIYLGSGLSAHIDALIRVKKGERISILFLDRENPHLRRHSWCFWQTQPLIDDSLIAKKWNEWEIRSGSKSALQNSNATPYCLVWSDVFLNHLKQELEKNAKCEWRFNEEIRSVKNDVVETTISSYRGLKLIDSRMDFAEYKKDTLIQDFCEFHLESKEDLWETNRVLLMDFKINKDAVSFIYLLPLATNKAILTTTYFTSNKIEMATHQRLFSDYIQEKGWSVQINQTILARLPMGFLKNANSHIGMLGGQIRPSTGYAFWQQQKQLKYVKKNRLNRLDQWLDRLFLSCIRNHPEQMPDIFVQLFLDSKPSNIIAFLQQEGGIKDRIHIVQNLPKTFFLKRMIYDTIL